MPDTGSEAVDITALAAMLRERRASSGKSLRQVAAETGVPFTTLSRVEAGKIPDLTTFRNIVVWLGIPPDRFFPTPRVRSESTPDAVADVLRRDPTLSDHAREQIVSVVGQLYAAATFNGSPVRMQLRSQKMFTPAAGALLSDLLQEMQDRLLDENG